MHRHNHDGGYPCEHTTKFCAQCQIVYCELCGKEWYEMVHTPDLPSGDSTHDPYRKFETNTANDKTSRFVRRVTISGVAT